jgi:hypothetical protein
MGEARPWQVAVVVVGLLVLIGSVVYQCTSRNEVELADSVILVDVTTGELIEAAYPGRAVGFPATHPDSGARTLMPAVQDPETGRWSVEGRYLGNLKDLGVKLDGLENPASGLVKKGGSPSRKKVFK